MKRKTKKKTTDGLSVFQQDNDGITKTEKDLEIIVKILQRQHENEALRKLLDNLDDINKRDQKK